MANRYITGKSYRIENRGFIEISKNSGMYKVISNFDMKKHFNEIQNKLEDCRVFGDSIYLKRAGDLGVVIDIIKGGVKEEELLGPRRFKTKDEFIRDFGDNWREVVKFQWDYSMDYLFGEKLSEENTGRWSISYDMLTNQPLPTKKEKSEKYIGHEDLKSYNKEDLHLCEIENEKGIHGILLSGDIINENIDDNNFVEYVVALDINGNTGDNALANYVFLPDNVRSKNSSRCITSFGKFKFIKNEPISELSASDLVDEVTATIDRLNKEVNRLKKENYKLESSIKDLEVALNVETDNHANNVTRLTDEAEARYKLGLSEGESNAKSKILKKKKVIKKEGRHEVWDNVIIDDMNYNKIQLAFNKNIPMLLKGPSGVGKSSIIRALGEENGLDVIQYNFNGDTTVEHLLGHKVLVGQSKKSDAPMVFEYGPLAHAVKYGGIFLADEINTCSVEVQFILNGLLETKNGKLGKLMVQGNNGEVIIPHKDFRFFGTYNPGYLGTKTFSMSTMSRMVGVTIEALSSDDEIKLLAIKFPKLTAEIALLVELGNLLRESKNFTYDVSTRDLEQALMFVEGGFSVLEAVNATIANSCQLDVDLMTLRDSISKITKK